MGSQDHLFQRRAHSLDLVMSSLLGLDYSDDDSEKEEESAPAANPLLMPSLAAGVPESDDSDDDQQGVAEEEAPPEEEEPASALPSIDDVLANAETPAFLTAPAARHWRTARGAMGACSLLSRAEAATMLVPRR